MEADHPFAPSRKRIGSRRSGEGSHESGMDQEMNKKSRTTTPLFPFHRPPRNSEVPGFIPFRVATASQKPIDSVCTSHLEQVPLQTARSNEVLNRGSSGSKRRTSIYFDPRNPTNSLFENPLCLPPSSPRNMTYLPGIPLPRVKTPPPEKRWPPYKTDKDKEKMSSRSANQAVPARLRVPKPVPHVSYPEFFDVSLRTSVKNQRKPQTGAAANLDVLRTADCGSRMQESPQISQDPHDIPLSSFAESPGNIANASDKVHVSNNFTQAINVSFEKPQTPAVTKRINANGQALQGFPCDIEKGKSIDLQAGALSEPHINKPSSTECGFEQNFKPSGVLGSTKAEGIQGLQRGHPAMRTFLDDRIEEAANRDGDLGKRDEIHNDSDPIEENCTTQAAIGPRKHGKKRKGNSPRRITDVFSNEDPFKNAALSLGLNESACTENVTATLTQDKTRMICQETSASRQLFPKQHTCDLPNDLAADQVQSNIIPMEVVSDGFCSIGKVDAPCAGDLPSRIGDVGDAFLANTQNSNLTDCQDELADDSIFRDLPALSTDEMLRLDAIQEELAYPADIDRMKSDEMNIDIDRTVLAANEALEVTGDQEEDLDWFGYLMSTNRSDEVPATQQPANVKKVKRGAQKLATEPRNVVGSSSSGVSKKKRTNVKKVNRAAQTGANALRNVGSPSSGVSKKKRTNVKKANRAIPMHANAVAPRIAVGLSTSVASKKQPTNVNKVNIASPTHAIPIALRMSVGLSSSGASQKQPPNIKEVNTSVIKEQLIIVKKVNRAAQTRATEQHRIAVGLSSSATSKKLPRLSICPTCFNVFRKHETFIMHVATAHIGQRNCTCCKECFFCLCDESARAEHVISCGRHKALKACFHCKLILPSHDELAKHMLEKHSSTSVPCRGSGNIIKPQVPIAQKNDLPCRGSGTGIKPQAPIVQEIDATGNGAPPFRCSQCSCQYSTKSGFERHLRQEHLRKIMSVGLYGMAKGKK